MLLDAELDELEEEAELEDELVAAAEVAAAAVLEVESVDGSEPTPIAPRSPLSCGARILIIRSAALLCAGELGLAFALASAAGANAIRRVSARKSVVRRGLRWESMVAGEKKQRASEKNSQRVRRVSKCMGSSK